MTTKRNETSPADFWPLVAATRAGGRWRESRVCGLPTRSIGGCKLAAKSGGPSELIAEARMSPLKWRRSLSLLAAIGVLTILVQAILVRATTASDTRPSGQHAALGAGAPEGQSPTLEPIHLRQAEQWLLRRGDANGAQIGAQLGLQSISKQAPSETGQPLGPIEARQKRHLSLVPTSTRNSETG